MIIAGESSGELYGALLAGAIRKLWPGVKILGVGGRKMKEAGVLLFAEITSAFGFLEAVSAYKKVSRTFDATVEMMKKVKPDVIVLIDYPDFNLRLAKVAKSMGIKVLYYVSPQIWAWRKGRIKTIGRLVDKVAVILPFEEGIYQSKGIPCEFVGHPVMEEIKNVSPEIVRDDLGLSETDKVIAILPGSRTNELDHLLPVLMDFVVKFRAEYPDYKIILPLAINIELSRYEKQIKEFEAAGVQISYGNAIQAMSVADAAVIASGTAALQGALVGAPLVVIYKTSMFSYVLARLLVDVKYISLVNLILNRPVVKELLQGSATTENIFKEVKRILEDSVYRNGMKDSFAELRKVYDDKDPSMNVSAMIGEIAGW